ncbi:MAG: TlyA family RNA methyltransferase [Tissierellia bacterium]|nr:TlyA family RNA methyltransferase [Tissierellia bacterium]
MKKARIDVLMFEKGLAESREKAKRIVMEGIVFVDDKKIDKPGEKVDVNSIITIKKDPVKYVSRGGLKLEKAIRVFNIDLNDKVALDIGASTGGFTDCMLQNGASKVYAVDVGYGQLDWKLRNDSRVVVKERTNIRYVTNEDIGEMVDFISIDVSFISLKLVLPVAKSLIKNKGEIVALVKPQFEAGKDKVGKKGLIRDKKIHIEVIEEIVDFCKSIGLSAINLDFSPVTGSTGNIEYLLHILNDDSNSINKRTIAQVVEDAHDTLY